MRSHPTHRATFGTCVALAAVTVLAVPGTVSAGQSAPADHEVTFTKDIAPILQRSCQHCHQPDSVAAMSLITYEDARPWARAMKLRTGMGPVAGVMPPLNLRDVIWASTLPVCWWPTWSCPGLLTVPTGTASWAFGVWPRKRFVESPASVLWV